MKYYSIVIFLFISLASQAQQYFKTPPGTIKLNDSLYIDKGPVDNLMYLEFINSIQKQWNYTLNDTLKSLKLKEIDDSLLSYSLNPKESEKIYKEITLLEDLRIAENLSIENYLSHPNYLNHPVVGISKKQAQLFCKWRSDIVNLKWAKEITDWKMNYHKIKYRLPTEKEYKLAKSTFRKRNKFLLPNETQLENIDMESLRNKDTFILYNIPEFTLSGRYLSGLKKGTKKPNDFTFFRCICELEE